MKRLVLNVLLLAAACRREAPPAAPPADAIVRHGGVNLVNETPERFDARMEWFRDAKFGMFIHWGLYSVAAGEWNGKPQFKYKLTFPKGGQKPIVPESHTEAPPF